MAIVHWRHLWQNVGPGTFNFNWDAIQHDSYVAVTVAEARTSPLVPDRFIGDAWPYVLSIAPHDGGVTFMVLWQSAFPTLNIWTDITVFDPTDPSGTN
jgi:hypothetical protein